MVEARFDAEITYLEVTNDGVVRQPSFVELIPPDPIQGSRLPSPEFHVAAEIIKRCIGEVIFGELVDDLAETYTRAARESPRGCRHVVARDKDWQSLYKSLKDTWADTRHGRLMLTGLGGLAEFEREVIRVTIPLETGPATRPVGLIPYHWCPP